MHPKRRINLRHNENDVFSIAAGFVGV